MKKWQWNKVYQSYLLAVLLLISGCISSISENRSPERNLDNPTTSTADTIISEILATLPAGKKLAFTGLSGLKGEKSELADLVTAKLEPAIINFCRNKGITLIERDKVQLIFNEWKLEMSGIAKSDLGVRELLGADIILTGKVVLQGKDVQIFLKTIDLKGGKLLNVVETLQPAEQYGLSGLPENKPSIDLPSSILRKNNYSISEDEKIKLWSKAASYSIGSKMTIFFEVSETSYISVINMTPDGEKTVIFPNGYQKDNLCKPGLTYQIPPSDKPFALEVTGPPGKNRIMAMISPKSNIDSSLVQAKGLKFTENIVNTTDSRVTIAFDIY